MQDNKKHLILVVDDEEDNRALLKGRLTRRNFDVACVSSGNEAMDVLDTLSPDLILLDIMMPGMDGLTTCSRIKEQSQNEFLPIILLTAKDDKESKIKGLETGADDYITKPFDMDELNARIRAMLRIRDLQRALAAKEMEVTRLTHELKGQYSFDNIIGASEAMREVFEKMQGAARISSPVIIYGESGSGKELIARGIHFASPQADKPFVPVNCAALPAELMESELFGHTKGAFTGAGTSSQGLFKRADGGTIFLDEISELPRDAQAKLLRTLQEGSVRPVGGMDEIKINTRVIAATNVELEEEVEDGRFREDLYYRISVLQIDAPPLRDRKADLPLLAKHFIKMFNDKFGRDIKGLDDAALETIIDYDWPGNVRELQNAIERCYVYADIEWISATHLTFSRKIRRRDTSGIGPGKDKPADGEERLPTLEEAEKTLIEKAMIMAENNKAKAAKLLGIHRSRLYKKLELYGLGL